LLWLMVLAGDPFSPARYLPYARNSLVLSGVTAVLAVLFAAAMAWAARLYPSPARSIANRVASLGYALPGSVIAVGVLVPFGLFDNALDSWLRARFGVSSGRRPGQAVREVEVPLARGALLTAGLLVFVDTMKELPATLIVRPFDLDTLAVRVYNLASDERLAEASTAAVLIVLVGLLPVAALTRMMRRE
jgi:iron(III) transport system permease protein